MLVGKILQEEQRNKEENGRGSKDTAKTLVVKKWRFKKSKHLKANASHVVKLAINKLIVRLRRRNLEVILLIMKKKKTETRTRHLSRKARTSHLKKKIKEPYFVGN